MVNFWVIGANETWQPGCLVKVKRRRKKRKKESNERIKGNGRTTIAYSESEQRDKTTNKENLLSPNLIKIIKPYYKSSNIQYNPKKTVPN